MLGGQGLRVRHELQARVERERFLQIRNDVAEVMPDREVRERRVGAGPFLVGLAVARPQGHL